MRISRCMPESSLKSGGSSLIEVPALGCGEQGNGIEGYGVFPASQAHRREFHGEHPLGALYIVFCLAPFFEAPQFGLADIPLALLGGEARLEVDMKRKNPHARRKVVSRIALLTDAHLGGQHRRECQPPLNLSIVVPSEDLFSNQQRGAGKKDVGLRYPCQSPVGFDVASLHALLRGHRIGQQAPQAQAQGQQPFRWEEVVHGE